MKNMFESAETFEAYATIDAGYYMLEQLNKRMSLPKLGIEAAIDKATGYDIALRRMYAKEALPIFEDILEAKRLIGADTAQTQQAIDTCKAIITT